MYKGKYIFYYYACFSLEKRNFGLYVKNTPFRNLRRGRKNYLYELFFLTSIFEVVNIYVSTNLFGCIVEDAEF